MRISLILLQCRPCSATALEIVFGVDDAAAGAAESKARPDDEREADVLGDCPRLVHIVGKGAFRQVQADALHGLLEFAAVLGPLDAPRNRRR